MALINKNIWLAFYFVAVFWALSLGIYSYNTYHRVYNEFIREQISLTKMTRNSLYSALGQYEILLNIVATQVLKNDQVVEKRELKASMQAAIELGSNVTAFGLFNLDGTDYVSVPVSPVEKGGSLLTANETGDTFQSAINARRMVIGRTYYNKALDSIVVPFRLAVRDSKGEARFILSIAVSLDMGFSFFIDNANESSLHNTYLYRDSDHYFQIAPIDRVNNPDIYLYQIPQVDIDSAVARVEKQLLLPFEQLKEQQQVITNKNLHPARMSLNASVYMKKYSLWLVTEVKLSAIQDVFIMKQVRLVFFHLISILLIYFLFRNIATSEKKKAQALQFQASHDYLTQLWNRHYFDRHLNSLDKNIAYSLIYLDIDHFKTVNDSYGHAVGDLLLKEVALRIKLLAASKDAVIRASSDEFVLICFHETEQQTNVLCDKLLNMFCRAFHITDLEIKLTASIGVSYYPKLSINSDDIKRDAGLALKSAKKQRNKAVFFNKTLLHDYLYQCSVEHELKKALHHNELYMQYQPQFSVEGKMLGVEALIRWHNKKLGFIPPDKFIPFAESIGAMDAIGLFVIKHSLAEMLALQLKTGYKFSVSINVSVQQFKDNGFFDKLMQIVKEFDFPTEYLILEVTESVLIDDLNAMQKLMLKIKEQKIRISLDDFGTGYSSLSMLNKLPIDELKIDRSFVIDVNKEIDTRAMVSTITSLAKTKGIKTVAEGVETQQMLSVLSELGCDIYQGYYFSKPIDASQLEQFMDAKTQQ